MSVLTESVSNYIRGSLNQLANTNFSTYALSLLSDAASALTDRSVGSSESYDAFLEYVSALGHSPKGIFGKCYPFIYSAMVGNNARADELNEGMFNFPKFTFYKNKPDIVLSDPENDIKEYFGQFIPDIKFSQEMKSGYEIKYSEENGSIEGMLGHPGDAHGGVESFNAVPTALGTNDLITKTNQLFNDGVMKTLIARFHTTDDQSTDTDNPLQTAISKQFGMSHGRNLLSGEDPVDSGYDNPYCRTWTYHHQYKDYARAIRPFVDGYDDSGDHLVAMSQTDLYNDYSWYAMGNNDESSKVASLESDKFDGAGRGRLDKLGVLSNQTGKPNFVPITKRPTDSNGRAIEGEDSKTVVDVKNCMFSIENLAWKVQGRQKEWFDINGLSDEQKGPLGGRIMWFPPYNIKFNESIKSNWESTKFIGRGEPIYTYSNTERDGNLEFDMLIDHPSVLDYWKGWEKNGQQNKGINLDLLNTGGVDNPDNQEQTILRFFAGCDILEANPRKCKVKVKKEPVDNNPQNPEKPTESPTKRIIFFVYFPNNYSGKDDDSEYAMRYLINGIGSQRASQITSLDTISGSSMAIDDVPVSIEKITVRNEGVTTTMTCGYEMTTNSVDLCKASSVQDLAYKSDTSYSYVGHKYHDCEYSNYITTNSPGTRAFEYQYKETDTKSGNQIISPLELHSSQYTLTATPITTHAIQFQYGSGAQYIAAKYIGSNATKSWDSNSERYLYRWYYRVDSDTQNQLLKTPHGYIDGQSYQLNSTGYKDVKTYMSDSLSGDTSDVTLVSLTDAFIATRLDESSAKNVLSGLYDNSNVETVKAVVNQEGNIKIKAIDIYGAASSHGNKQVYNKTTNKVESVTSTDISRNNTLAEHRAQTVGNWLKAVVPSSVGSLIKVHQDSKSTTDSSTNKAVYNTSILQPFGTSEKPNDVDNEKEKIYRSAAVIIEYTNEAVTNADAVNSPTQTTEDLVGSNPKYTRIVTSDATSELQSLATNTLPLSNKDGSVNDSSASKNMSFFSRMSDQIWNSLTETQRSNLIAIANNNATNPASSEDKKKDDEFTWETMPRYDNEGEFFQELQTHDPNMMHLISQKVRYFEPAYHAVSPEGFAARLTFLQQCTRQGNTTAAGDKNALTANNLAFGAPPVCVLRIGDFYYTRIIIETINITYDPLMWDLNQEGIGVMPMMAHVTINFHFIGGSDLGGPISRLQNAVSFNYYANTSVYDNRAEQVKYKENRTGDIIKFKAFEVDQSQDETDSKLK